MKAPITEQNASPRPHPGESMPPPSESELRQVIKDKRSDDATIRAIKGKGIVATISPHFAVAVIVGVTSYFAGHKPDPVSETVGNEAHRCNESVTQLRADFVQFKAEMALHNMLQEKSVNDLLARTSPSLNQPRIEPSSLAPDINRVLGR